MTKIALVTGGSKGIGYAAAKALYDIGYTVIVAARNEETLQQCAQGLAKERFIPLVADVTDESAVNNSPAKSIEEVEFTEWTRVFNANIHSTFLCSKEAIKIMKAQQPMGGRIINNASISALTPRLYTAPYTASKHAVTGLTKAISLDCRKFNIACGQINIGNAETTLSNRMRKGVYQADGAIKAEDMMNVADVAATIQMMAQLPVTTNVLEITIMANNMPYVGRG